MTPATQRAHIKEGVRMKGGKSWIDSAEDVVMQDCDLNTTPGAEWIPVPPGFRDTFSQSHSLEVLVITHLLGKGGGGYLLVT